MRRNASRSAAPALEGRRAKCLTERSHEETKILSQNLGVVVGIAAAVAIVMYLRGRRLDRRERLRSAGVGMLVAAVAAGVVVYVAALLRDDGEDTAVLDRAMADAHAMPMVGVVLDDVPGSLQQLREALKEEMHRPTSEGVSRPLKLMRQLRADYVVPALGAADEATAGAAIDARSALLRHLQRTDLTICKEFALTGIQQTERLDAVGQRLMREVLAALEKAYRSGRAVKRSDSAAPHVASDTEAHRLLAEAGFTPQEFDMLAHLARLPERDACSIALKFNDAPARLPPQERGPMMRYLLTVQ